MRKAYVPDGEILTDFVFDDSEVAIIQGPVGSGTSSALVNRIMRHAQQQQPNSDGHRRTKWYVSRPTYKDLLETFYDTYMFWMEPGRSTPPLVGNGPITHHIRPDDACGHLQDGTKLDFELIMQAVQPSEAPAYYQQFDSYEMTGWVVNEAQQYIEKIAIDKILTRAEQGRFPPKMEGGPSWSGVLMDLNAPPQGHWITYMRGDVDIPMEWGAEKRLEFSKPDNWKFFLQPPAILEKFDANGKFEGYAENPAAENARWRKKPYLDQIRGKSRDTIETYYLNRTGSLRQGDPVHSAFSMQRHVRDGLVPVEGIPLVIGIDGARHPFATVWQNVRRNWRCYGEFGMQGVAASTFGPKFRAYLMRHFSDYLSFTVDDDGKHRIVGANFWGDPSVTRKGDGTNDSFQSVMAANGFNIKLAPGNNSIEIRRGAMDTALLRTDEDGDPAILVDGKMCPTLKTALYSGYVLDDTNQPDKKKSKQYADCVDSAHYALLGGGEGSAVLGRSLSASKPIPIKRKKRSWSRL